MSQKDKLEEFTEEIEEKTLTQKIDAAINFIITWGWLIAVVSFLIISNWITIVRSSGDSMVPTINDSEFFVCNRTVKTYDYNDIVVIQTNEPLISIMDKKILSMKIIKRIVGLPGDTLYIEDGALYVNGEKIETDFPIMEAPGILNEEITLSENTYFVLGDNRNNSADSRVYGPFTKEQIYGKIILKNKQ